MDRKLRRAVLEQLAAIEAMAAQHIPVHVARIQLTILTEAWRALLLQHQPDPQGRCPVCSGWFRRRRWPCQVWVTAHQHLIGDGSEPMEKPDQKSQWSRHPRQVEVIPRQVSAQATTDQIRPGRDAGETKDHPQPMATRQVPIHRAAVIERRPAIPGPRPVQRSRT